MDETKNILRSDVLFPQIQDKDLYSYLTQDWKDDMDTVALASSFSVFTFVPGLCVSDPHVLPK